MIQLKHVCYSYDGIPAVDDVSLTIRDGEAIAIMGPNASGKSTLARIINALLLPDSGDCIVDGINTRDDPYHARQRVGMVFQDPEDQIVSRRVEDDVIFGPLNLGLPAGDIALRVKEALSIVKMETLAGRSTRGLSGGQKQRLAIAGILAMRPSYIALDEPTSLLDSEGTLAVREAIAMLKGTGTGIIIITHDPYEAMLADNIVILDRGQVAMQGSPAEVLSKADMLDEIGLDVPDFVRMSRRFDRLGFKTAHLSWSVDEAVKELCLLW